MELELELKLELELELELDNNQDPGYKRFGEQKLIPRFARSP